MAKIEEAVQERVEKLLDGTKYELVDVEYVKEKNWYLRIFIDKEGGVDLDDCQQVSGKIDALLEKEDLIGTSYILEVSSPGLDRILKKERDLVREEGKSVDVTLYQPIEGQKTFTGKLTGHSDTEIYLDDNMTLARDKIATIRLHIDF